jgi:hypothetical protein
MPTCFLDMMMHILKDLLVKVMVVSIDDILRYAKQTEEYQNLIE